MSLPDINPADLEREFAEALAPVEDRNSLVITGINHVTGESYTDVYEVNDAAEPKGKVVMVVRDILTNQELKITVEELKTNG